MKSFLFARTAALCSLICCLFAGCASPQGLKSRAASSSEILKLSDKYYEAYFGGDTTTLDELESNDFIVVGNSHPPESTAGRYAGIAQAVKEKRWYPGGVTREVEQVNVRFFGNTAILHSISKVKGQKETRVLTTEVWVKAADQKWEIVHLHFNFIDESGRPS